VRISSATTAGTARPLSASERGALSSSRVMPARHATFKRFGAWSGKSIVILRSAAIGRSGRHARSPITKAIAETARTRAHHATDPTRECPRWRRCPVTRAVTMEIPIGAVSATPATRALNHL